MKYFFSFIKIIIWLFILVIVFRSEIFEFFLFKDYSNILFIILAEMFIFFFFIIFIVFKKKIFFYDYFFLFLFLSGGFFIALVFILQQFY